MRQSQNPLNVSVGDVVKMEITVYREPEKRYVTARVLKVAEAYGSSRRGGPRMTPIIDYINLATGEKDFSNIAWVTEVVERNPLAMPPANPFRETPERRFGGIERRSRGSVAGMLPDLVIYYLARLPYRLNQSKVSEERVRELFERQRPGLIERWPHTSYVVVHERPFREWVRRNASRLLATVRELDEAETEYQEEYAKQYEADFLREMREEFEDIGDPILDTVDPSWAEW